MGAPYFMEADNRFIERVLGKLHKLPEDDINTDYNKVMSFFKSLLLEENKYNKILDLTEIMLND